MAGLQEGESEWDEVERELGSSAKQAEDSKPSKGFQQVLRRYFSPVFVEALVLNFLAEWGDRSQVSLFVSAVAEPERLHIENWARELQIAGLVSRLSFQMEKDAKNGQGRKDSRAEHSASTGK